jgi:membrane protease YdiL (CAAX protease family)
MKPTKAFTSVWSCTVFAIMLIACLVVMSAAFSPALAVMKRATPTGTIDAGYAFVNEVIISAAVLFAFQMMRWLHREPLQSIKLTASASPYQIVIGGACGLLVLSVLEWLLHTLGVLTVGVSGQNIFWLEHVGVMWAICFLLTGLCEEAVFRGYLLETLANGIGFWPAALITSGLFAAIHTGNNGENVSGLLTCGVYAILFALSVRVTGRIWYAVGFHAGWDWAETFVFGTANSGLRGEGHLLITEVHGSHWISGGSVGPEGSVVAMAIAGILILALWQYYRRGQKDNPVLADPAQWKTSKQTARLLPDVAPATICAATPGRQGHPGQSVCEPLRDSQRIA